MHARAHLMCGGCCLDGAYGAEARQQLGPAWIAAPRLDHCCSDTPTLVTHFLSLARLQQTSSSIAMANPLSVFWTSTRGPLWVGDPAGVTNAQISPSDHQNAAKRSEKLHGVRVFSFSG